MTDYDKTNEKSINFFTIPASKTNQKDCRMSRTLCVLKVFTAVLF